MHRGIVLFMPLAIIASTGFLSTQENITHGAITGTVAYPQHVTLPLDALISIRLEEVSQADAQATVLNESIVSAAEHEVPIPFTLSYDPAVINPSHTYQVRATIIANGTLLFTSKVHRVLTHGAPTSVVIPLQQVGGAPASVPSAANPVSPLMTTPAASSVMILQQTRWKLVQLGGQPFIASKGGTEPWIVPHKDNKFSGSTGCNEISGTYTLEQNALQFKLTGTTAVVCTPEVTKQERAFALALLAARSYRIQGDTLQLLLGNEVLGAFRAQKK